MAGHAYVDLQEANREFERADEAAKNLLKDVAVLAFRLCKWNPVKGNAIQSIMGEACGDDSPHVTLANWPTVAKIEQTLSAHSHAWIKQQEAQAALKTHDQEDKARKQEPLFKTAKT